jgi:hypothetical protein
MFKASRKLIFKLAVLVLMTAGVFIAQNNKVSAWDCLPCPDGYHCNYWTSSCECNCPDPLGGCPMSCA